MRKRAIRLSTDEFEQELNVARSRWGTLLTADMSEQLLSIVMRTGLRVSTREIQLIDGSLYVNHAGLLRLAQIAGCSGIETQIEQFAAEENGNRWVVKATVIKAGKSKRSFVGLGDANPCNVGQSFRGCELRIAETRAVNRAIRKAFAVPLCSVEELQPATARLPVLMPNTGERTEADVGEPADRLRLVMREYDLDPAQLRDYACRYLNVGELRDADRNQLMALVSHLEQFAGASPVWLRGELSRCSLTEMKEKTQ